MSSPTVAAPEVSVRSLLRLAWPVIVSRSTQAVLGLGDAWMVAPLGEDAVAATTTGAFNAIAVLILPMGMAFIVASFASQLTGAGDAAGARRYGVYGLVLSGLTQVVCLAVLPVLGLLLSPFEYTPEVRALVLDYLWLRLLSGGAATGIEALANYYGGLGRTRLPMVLSLAAMVLDLAGNWMLIGGHWGAPAMGVAGAALSSSISVWVVFAVFLGIFLLEGRAREGRLLPRGLRVRELLRMLRFGVPSGLNWFLEFLAFHLFINMVVAGLGTAALAAFMVVMNVNSVAFMPAFAISSAGAILVGQCIGAGRKDDVVRVLRRTWGVMVSWQVGVSLVYLVVPLLVLRPFTREEAQDAAFLVLGARMLRLSTAWQLFDATGMAVAETLRAAGDTSFPLWTRVVLAWALFFPGAWVSVRVLGHGDVAAMLWVVLYLAALAAVLLWRFRSGAWRHITLVEPELGGDVAAPGEAR